jgi:small subunit ribosomal protein S16
MLTIRMKRTGRRGHAQYRVVVQDSRFSPSSGRVVTYLGSYNPHTKETTLDKEKAGGYLQNGAQPSERVARLLQREGVELPAWVKLSAEKQRSVRNAEKRRSTTPKDETPVEEPAAATEPEATEEAPVEAQIETPAEDTPTEETPAEEANAATE